MASKIAKGLFNEKKKEEEEKKRNEKEQEKKSEKVVEEEEEEEEDQTVSINENIDNEKTKEKEKKIINDNLKENETIKDENSPVVSSFQFTPSESALNQTPEPTTTTANTITSNLSNSSKKDTNLVEIIVTWILNWLSLIAPIFGILLALLLLKIKETSSS